MSTPLGPILAVYSDVALCDGPHEHEARLITEAPARTACDLGSGSALASFDCKVRIVTENLTQGVGSRPPRRWQPGLPTTCGA